VTAKLQLTLARETSVSEEDGATAGLVSVWPARPPPADLGVVQVVHHGGTVEVVGIRVPRRPVARAHQAQYVHLVQKVRDGVAANFCIGIARIVSANARQPPAGSGEAWRRIHEKAGTKAPARLTTWCILHKWYGRIGIKKLFMHAWAVGEH